MVKPSNTSLFYGINGHMAWGSGIYFTMTAEQQLAILKDLGVTMYRCDTADAGMSATLAMALRGAFAGSGVASCRCSTRVQRAGTDGHGSRRLFARL